MTASQQNLPTSIATYSFSNKWKKNNNNRKPNEILSNCMKSNQNTERKKIYNLMKEIFFLLYFHCCSNREKHTTKLLQSYQ